MYAYIHIKIVYFLAVIYFKNLICQNWGNREDEPTKFTIHEQDRAMIRDTIYDVIIQVPELLR